MTATVTTNSHWRDFKYRYEVPPEVLADQFDWTDADHEEHGSYSDGFIQYRGHWYHLGDFMRGGHADWHGSCADGFFSGTLIRLSEDGEQYQIARVTS